MNNLVVWFGSRGGETRVMRKLQRVLTDNPVEVADFIVSKAPCNSRWRRYAGLVHSKIKNRSKAAIAAKAELNKFIMMK